MSEQFAKRELKLLQRGDKNTLERWFNAYSDTLYTFIFYRVGKNHDKAVDIVQETLLTAMRQIERYDPEHSSMFIWLTRLSKSFIKNLISSRLRGYIK